MLKIEQRQTSHIKCGEVYYMIPSIFHIYCMECGQKVLFQQFLQHYRLQHLTQAEDSIRIEPMKIEKEESNYETDYTATESDFEHDDDDENIFSETEDYLQNEQEDDVNDERTDSIATIEDGTDILLEVEQEEYITIEQITDLASESFEGGHDLQILPESNDKINGNCSVKTAQIKEFAIEKIELAYEEYDYESVQSNEKYNNIENDTNMENENNKHFECQICHRLLKTKYILSNHMRVVHADKPKNQDVNISCRFCNANCKSRFDLLVHKRKFHAERYASNVGALKPQIEEDEALRPVPCSLCERRFRNESSLAIHMRIHKDKQKGNFIKPKVTRVAVCEICGKTCRSKRHLERHQKRFHGSTFCDICGKEFKQPLEAYRHKTLHFKPKKFKCIHCDISCYSPSGLKKHLRTHAPKEHSAQIERRKHPTQDTTRHICEICGRDFRTSYQLNNHMQRHNNERPFKCDNCEKRFYSRQLLKLHSVTHSSERPFICDICGATFQYKRALRVHADLHTGFRNYKCSFCDKAYVDGGRLKTHIRLVHGINLALPNKSTDLNEREEDDCEVETATKNLEEIVKRH